MSSQNKLPVTCFTKGPCTVVLTIISNVTCISNTPFKHIRIQACLWESWWWSYWLPTNWFSSYLSNRRQAVRINSALSEKLTVQSGVTQGSILEPILFSIYVNDLFAIPQHCSSKVFIDDYKLNYIHLFLFNNVNLQYQDEWWLM